MNTPSHLLIGAAVFARPDQGRVTLAAMVGGVIPDIPLICMVAWSIWVAGIPPETVFGRLYFSDAWQQVFSVDHSFIVWGAAFALAQWRGWSVLRAFAGAGLLHAGVDFLVHHDDARRQFWPVSDWVFHSPVSYWDRAHYGGIVAPVEGLLDLICAVLLWRRLGRVWERAVVVGAALMVALPMVAFAVMMGHGEARAAPDPAAIPTQGQPSGPLRLDNAVPA